MLPSNELALARVAIGAVWLYQGIWCKILGRTPEHVRIVEASPLCDVGTARVVLLTIGCIETMLGIWVLSNAYSHAAAVAQIMVLMSITGGGLLWARHLMPDPAGTIFQNFAFGVLIWLCR